MVSKKVGINQHKANIAQLSKLRQNGGVRSSSMLDIALNSMGSKPTMNKGA